MARLRLVIHWQWLVSRILGYSEPVRWILPLLNFIFSEKLSAIYVILLFQKFKKTQNRLYLCNRWSYDFLKPLFYPKGSKMRFYIYMGHTIWNLAFWFEQCRELSNVENWAMSRIEKFPVSRVEYFITENHYLKK